MSPFRVGLDLMGSDTAPDRLLKSIQEEITASQSLLITCYVEKKYFKTCQKTLHSASDYISLFSCQTSIRPDEDPLKALREKNDSTLVQGILGLKNQELDAFISLGSTGALISAATLYLKCFSPIKRPSLVAKLPKRNGFIYVADVGGNVKAKTINIVNSAYLAGALAKIENPEKKLRLGLLNIGQEGLKGASSHQEAFKELELNFPKSSELEFIGNIEPKFAFSSDVDVIASDGLSGNIFLKTAEGMAEFIFDTLEENKKKNFSLSELLPLFDYAEYPGALVGGVEGLVIKCHGYSSPKTVVHSLLKTKELLQNSFLEKYKECISH